MASGELARRDGAQFRHLVAASLIGARAAGAETAAGRRRDRRRRLADRHGSRPDAHPDRAPGSPRSAARYRDAPAVANSCSEGPTSQSRPRYITATRSLTAFTTARSCAMNSSVKPKRAFISSSRLRIWARIETSSAETGSSQMMNSGIEHQRAGDADALALPAGEFVRQPSDHQRRDRGRPRSARRRPAACASPDP